MQCNHNSNHIQPQPCCAILTSIFGHLHRFYRNPEVSSEDSDYWDRIFVTRGSALPTFLQPAMDLVMLSGKSRHLMEAISGRKDLSPQAAALLGQSYSAVELVRISPSGLYRDLLQSVEDTPGGRSCDTPTSQRFSHSGSPDSDLPSSGQSSGESKRTSHYDALMRVYLMQLEDVPLQDSCTDQVWSSSLVEQIVEHPCRSLCYPLTTFIQDLISSHFRGHYQKVR